MRYYSLGFAFSEDCSNILLIKKLKPDWQNGFFNGVGGKCENQESFFDTIRRETFEEVGLELPWKICGKMIHKNKFNVAVFFSYSDKVYDFRRKEEERPFLLDSNTICIGNDILSSTKIFVQYGLVFNNEFMTINYTYSS